MRKLGREKGIELSYVDTTGKRREVSDETLRAILALRGVPVSNSREITASEQRERAQQLDRPIPPVLVAWDGRLPRLRKITQDQKVSLRVRFEDGTEKKVQGGDFRGSLHQLFSPQRKLPSGYHELELETRQRTFKTLIIAAPRRSYTPRPSEKAWGIFMPLYALRSRQSWGAGNLGDLGRLGEWVAGQGGRVLSTLPLMSTFLRGKAFDPSPYSPISRLFWNEFYLDIEALSEFRLCRAAQKKFASTGFQNRLRAVRREGWVDYRQQMALRREVLQLLARFFFQKMSQAGFQKFLRERPLTRDYARFRAVYDRVGLPWQLWPQRLREGAIQDGDYDADDEQYHLYSQWAVQRQMESLVANSRNRNLSLYLDLPVGVNRTGFDVWREQGLFAPEPSAGAPPDAFFSQGQNWGFPPMIPERLRETGYRHVIDYLRFQMRHAGMLRIDHVMGLHRMYWIPQEFPASQGAYVRYPAEELHAIVCLESHRNQCEIIGENLGTVPPEVNQAMREHGHGRMYVVQFEQRPEKRALKEPSSNMVASLDTHDTATFPAYWRGLDIPFRAKLGLLKKGEVAGERLRRKELNRCSAKFLKRKGFLRSERADADAVMRALLRWLRAGPARVVLISLEDLWEETRPQNVPGTSAEYPNWRRKAKWSLEKICRMRLRI